MAPMLDLDPHDRLLAAVVKQAIADVRSGPPCEREAARQYLASIGLVDDDGDVVAAVVADVTCLWVAVE